MDDTQCHGLLFHMIFCFSLLWTPSRSQHLYQSGCDSEHDSFYRSCKEKALETNIQRLEEQNKILFFHPVSETKHKKFKRPRIITFR